MVDHKEEHTQRHNKLHSAANEKAVRPEPDGGGKNIVIGVLSVSTIGLLISTIVLGVGRGAAIDELNSSTEASTASSVSNVPDNKFFEIETIFKRGENTCADAKYEVSEALANVDCIHLPGPQAGENVTKGYQGGMEVDYVPNTEPYWKSSMCPVNVHWHLGSEHYSLGEYDENGNGPHGNIQLEAHSDNNDDYHDGGNSSMRSLKADDHHHVRGGFRCHHYDSADEKFTKDYEWKHCKEMEVGETYEVHWPHSAAGACGTVNQYQTPFYDGVFCNLGLEALVTLKPQQIANAVGVQGQVFTIVNDESYFYPDLIRGWVADGVDGMAQDIAYYTGSTTGTTRNNKICSAYAPITWQVDRKCHMISASSFDKLCYDMKLQRDDMGDDLHAHGARELVKDSLVANNMQRKLKNDNHHQRDGMNDEIKGDHDLTAAQMRHLRSQ
mmetsp:Transcript_40207/g.78580  ORF Transcript_40207/g.78580 Transcript_40207/m.78580 type:complete len:441 (+) Transcript_40207:411-1733(+)|eukprot:CAMPEP_0194317946 /NCGR_PEP_ID=MMETSP0171-20130528/14610_1 /TAXON_ID=218684 /ORGANISM="Corethron pennatum, Strain L29A3" /LENGTH=440 /DNA_ID=CAMNT_0039074689 /DNA_START=233 /DNA_END=1555 /DNA_ORIENTATION=+